MKIYLNKTAQKMLFSYYEGVDWAETLCEENPNPKNSPTDDYISLSDEEKNRIHNKIITWVGNYEKLFNGKYADIETDDETLCYLSIDSENQAALINEEVLNPGNDVEDMFEAYMSTNGREYERVIRGKENLYKEYKEALKQFRKIANMKTTSQPQC